MKKSLFFLMSLVLATATAFGQITMPAFDGGSSVKDVSSETAFYDAGGQDGDAKAWQNKAITLKPQAGKLLEITFTEVSLNSGTYISIFNGEKALDEDYDYTFDETTYSVPSGERMKIESGATVPIVIRSVAPSKPLTVMLHSEGSPGAGWVASVKNVDAPPVVPEDAPAVVNISEMPKIYLVNDEIDFYDDGGQDGKITEGFEGYVTFKPKDASKFIKITFNKLELFDTNPSRNDKLEFFKGTSTEAANLIKTLLDEPTPITIKSTEAGQGITVKLKSTTGVPKAGWEAKVVEFTPSPMVFKSLTSAKGEEGEVSAGAKDVKMMNFVVKTESSLNALTLDKVKLNLGTDFALVKAVKLYGYDAKGEEKLLATASVSAEELSLNPTETFALAEGENKFFVSYDVSDSAENGKKLSAQLQAVTLTASEHQATGSETFERTIKNVYYSKVGSFEQKVSGEWEFTHTKQSKYSDNYKANNKDEIITFLPANDDEQIELEFKDFVIYMSNSSYGGTKAKFVIYDGKGTNGTVLWEATADNKDKGPETIIRSKSSDGAITVLFNSKTTSSYYTEKGWHATVRSYKPSPMTFDALEVTQVEKDNPVIPNKDNQPILSLNFKTLGGLTPIQLKGLKLNLKGAEGYLKNIKLYATEGKGEFATSFLLKTLIPQAGTFEVALDNALVEGENFLWLCYELKGAVPSDTPFDAKVEAYTLSTGSEVPVDASLGNPDGERISKNIYLLEEGTEIKDVQVTSSLLFYDDGGKDGNLTKGIKGAVHFIPNDGEEIHLIFKKKQDLYSKDKLIIYNGKSREKADELLKVNPYKKPKSPIISKAKDGSLTVDFSAYKYGKARAGWEIEVISYKPLPLSLESVASEKANDETTALAGAKNSFITLTAKVVGDKGELAPLQSLKVETTGTTDVADIEKLFVYATEKASLFTEAKLVGEATPSADGSATTITIKQNKCKVSEAGEHKYTLVALTKASAKAGNTIALKASEANEEAIDATLTVSRTIKEGLKGTYIVGTSADANYKDFEEVLEALKGGVSGAVVFEVEDATYPKLEIPAVNGLSETNTLTIRPKSGERGGVIFESNKSKPSGYDPNPQDYSVIHLNNTSNIKLEKLVVKTNQNDYEGVILVQSSPNVSIKDCKVIAPRGVSIAEDVVLINSIGNGEDQVSLANKLNIEDCELIGGRQGIYINANKYPNEMPQRDITIRGNRLSNQGSSSIYSGRVQDLLIQGNQITGNGEAGNEYFAMDIVLMKGITVKDNVIEAYGMTKTKNNLTICGLQLRQAVPEDLKKFTGHNTIINNSIRLVPNAEQKAYALAFKGSKHANLAIVHNTVKIIAPNSTDQNEETSIVKFLGGSKKEFENINLYGNLFQNLAEGSAYQIFGSWDKTGIKLSYNAVYASTEKFAHIGTEDKTFDEWKALITEIYHDKLAKASFRNFSSMELDEEAEFTFVPVGGPAQKYDITGKERKNPSTAGAYEFVEGLIPTFAEGYPKQADVTFESAKLEFKVNASGKMLYIVKKKDETAPTLEEVSKSDKSLSLETNKVAELPLAKLEEATQYTIYTLLVSPRGEKATKLETFDFTTKKKVEPLELTLAEVQPAVQKDQAVHLVAEHQGGLAPFTYKWTNAKDEVLSTEKAFDYTPAHSEVIFLTLKDSKGQVLKSQTTLIVEGVQAVAGFEDLKLEDDSYWRGDEDSATPNSTFYSGSYKFANFFDKKNNYFNGFAYSSETSTSFDPLNFSKEQFRNVVGSGVEGSHNYAVVYTGGNSAYLEVNNQTEGEDLAGFYITNTAWVKHCSEHGTGFGAQADKPFAKGDYLKLIITADNGVSLTYFLADYRSDNSKEHYTLDKWAYLDLSSLGKIKKLSFKMDGTRQTTWAGQSSTTIPTYFCMDNLGAQAKEQAVPVEVFKDKLSTFDLHKLLDKHLPTEWKDVAKFKLNDKGDKSILDLNLKNNQLSFKLATTGDFHTGVIAQGHGETHYFDITIKSIEDTALESLEANSLVVYPNPAIHSIEMNESGLVRIYSLSGKLVLEQANYQVGARLDISHLPSGTYIVKLGSQVERFIKR